jgi:hypothetical protein
MLLMVDTHRPNLWMAIHLVGATKKDITPASQRHERRQVSIENCVCILSFAAVMLSGVGFVIGCSML